MSGNNSYQHQQSMDTIRDVARDLLDLSSAFLIVGNDRISETLHCMAVDLAEATKNATQARRDRLNEEYKESQAEVGTIISALLKSVVPTEKRGN